MKQKIKFFFIPLLFITLSTSCIPLQPAQEKFTVFSYPNANRVVVDSTLDFVGAINNEEFDSSLIEWSILEGTTLAEISDEGVFLASDVGEVTIGAKYKDHEEKKTISIWSTEGTGVTKAKSATMHANQFLAHWGSEEILPAVGNQKILVVPVQFTNGLTWNEYKLSTIEKAFFGENKDTAWESVSSFYRKTSYGKLKITGTVADPVQLSLTVDDAEKLNEDHLLKSVSDQFYATASPDLLKAHDVDNDGYVDATCFIYANPYSSSSSSNLWAWVWSLSNAPNTTKPTINNHMWASLFFTNDGYGSGSIDAHTYIHETGHLLGLDDYYSYGTYQPAGGWDMMDNNVLDHNAYSKFLKEWSYPYYVDGTKEVTNITIEPSESSGDFILVKDNWNGSPIDEYLLVEFYSPTGLNQKDAKEGYMRSRPYSVPGIKIYHIDSRGVEVSRTGSFVKYINSPLEIQPNKSYGIAATNLDPTYSLGPFEEADTNKLVHLMEATGTNSFKRGSSGTNNTLFKEGQSFVASSVFFPNGTKFNSGEEVGYKITINSVSLTEANLTITKL